MRRLVRSVLAAAVLALLAGAPPIRADNAVDYARLSDRVVEHHIRPAYAAFQARAWDLEAAVAALCPAVEDKALAAARLAFHRAVDAWEAAEHIRFGPALEVNAHARLNFWPDRRGKVGKHLRRLLAREDAAVLAPARFAKGSVAVQGFPALERLLFEDDAAARLADPGGAVTPCAVAMAIAHNVAAIAGEMNGRWQGNPLANRKAKDTATSLFTSLAGGVEAVADLKLGGPLGIATGRVRPRRAEHWRSHRGLRDVVVNLKALRDLYVHMSDGAGRALTDTDEDALVRILFDQVIEDAGSLGPSMAGLLKTEKGVHWAKALHGGLKDLRETMVANTAEALGLVLGFNSFDGD